MMRRLRRFRYVVLYYLSWLLFAVGGLLLNLVSVPLLPWAGRPGLASSMRLTIRRLFRVWTWWLDGTGVVRLRWRGFSGGLRPGCVYIANHPCLLDATILLSCIPDAVCILKPRLMRNPAIGAAARVACYEPGDNMIDLVHRVSRDVAAGGSLLVFPEGTRTQPGTLLGHFRSGFALVAERAGAPVRLIAMRSSEGLVPRGRAWWKPPTVLPAWIELELGPELAHGAGGGAAALGLEAETLMRELLARQAGKSDASVSKI